MCFLIVVYLLKCYSFITHWPVGYDRRQEHLHYDQTDCFGENSRRIDGRTICNCTLLSLVRAYVGQFWETGIYMLRIVTSTPMYPIRDLNHDHRYESRVLYQNLLATSHATAMMFFKFHFIVECFLWPVLRARRYNDTLFSHDNVNDRETQQV